MTKDVHTRSRITEDRCHLCDKHYSCHSGHVRRTDTSIHVDVARASLCRQLSELALERLQNGGEAASKHHIVLSVNLLKVKGMEDWSIYTDEGKRNFELMVMPCVMS